MIFLSKMGVAHEMVAGLSHEMGQPLGAIANYARAAQMLIELERRLGVVVPMGELIHLRNFELAITKFLNPVFLWLGNTEPLPHLKDLGGRGKKLISDTKNH